MLLSITNDILEQNKIVNVWHRQSILFAVGKLREASDQLTTGRSDSLGEVQAPVVQFFVLIVAVEEGLPDTFCCNRKQTKAPRATFSFRIGEREVQTSLSCSKCALSPWVSKCSWTWTTSVKYVFILCWTRAHLLIGYGREHLISSYGKQWEVRRMCCWFGRKTAWADSSTMQIPPIKVKYIDGTDKISILIYLTCIPQILFERSTLSRSN